MARERKKQQLRTLVCSKKKKQLYLPSVFASRACIAQNRSTNHKKKKKKKREVKKGEKKEVIS